jgi:tRNA nucleotidyltransferase (CCA-adding enzyme)
MQTIKTYLVGGAVRDQLLGGEVLERDWVVVGASPKTMLEQGYKQVGKDFPVFLHPSSKEEYALARTEKKTGQGYTGFLCNSAPSVTLEEDLLRRDLTINAIAQTQDGQLIDPFGGQKDITNKVLRHVSPAFVEDPLRVLRVARFAAKLPLFSIAPETMQLMTAIAQSGELQTLSAERIWREWEKALNATAPLRFITTLHCCAALPSLMPELEQHYDGIKQQEQIKGGPDTQFCYQTIHLNIDQLTTLCQRIKVPKAFQAMAMLSIKHIPTICQLSHVPEQVLDLLNALDAFRRQQRFAQWLLTIKPILKIMAPQAIKHLALLQHCQREIAQNKIDPKLLSQTKGKESAQVIHQHRLNLLQRLLAS